MHAVTGAFGYSGRYMAARLLAEGQRVVTLTNSPGRKNPLCANVEVRPLAFGEPDRLAAALAGVDVLYNTYWVRFNHRLFTHAQAVENTLALLAAARTAVFHSSGTTAQQDSRHFHSAESLAVYEASLWPWFAANVLENFPGTSSPPELIILTPPPAAVPHSSLVHMFECVRKAMRRPSASGADANFFGQLAADGAWRLDFPATLAALENAVETNRPQPLLLLGTAFSFVHLLDFLAEKNLTLRLPAGSRVMETGGYKNRSRVLPKAELHALITARLGVSPENILCEYGMSELSSQAYDARRQSARGFQFPPWVRVQIISPETGGEVNLGETGLLRVLDLANVLSVGAIQTEDLAVRRADGFELVGRAVLAEPRGCSLMNA